MGAEKPNSKPSAPKADPHIPDADRRIALIRARNKRIVLLSVSVCLCVCILFGLLASAIILLRKPADDGKILANVTVGGINIGKMEPAEAKNLLRLALGDPIANKNMSVALPSATLVLTPEDSQAQLDVDALIADAYAYGRTGSTAQQNLIRLKAETSSHVIPLLPYLNLNFSNIRSRVNAFCDSYSRFINQPTAALEGTRPEFGADSVTHQTLVLTTGTPQFILDSQDLYNTVLDAYSLFRLELQYEAPDQVEPEAVDLDEIFNAFCTAPQDARMDPNTFAVTPEVIGYGFDIAAVQQMVDTAGYGQVIRIQLGFLLPDITAQDLAGSLFKDVLASYTARCPDAYNANRNVNLQLSCQAINGYVIKPGESFDFNGILGPRTAESGYKNAPNYSGSTTSSIGGGISQTASALHYCAMLAGLQIDEHHSHRYAVSYTPMGTDSAINYGSENLVLTNNTTAPIRVLATLSGSDVTVTLLGTQDGTGLRRRVETDIIEMILPVTVYQPMAKDNVFGYVDGQILESSHTGYKVQVYLVTYDPDTNQVVDRRPCYAITYEKRDKLVVRIEGTDVP